MQTVEVGLLLAAGAVLVAAASPAAGAIAVAQTGTYSSARPSARNWASLPGDRVKHAGIRQGCPGVNQAQGLFGPQRLSSPSHKATAGALFSDQ